VLERSGGRLDEGLRRQPRQRRAQRVIMSGVKRIHGLNFEDYTRHAPKQPKPASGKRQEPKPQKPKKRKR
jgi:hypothetical protein